MDQNILAIDFDSTIVTQLEPYDANRTGNLIPGAKEGIDKLKSLGYKIIIFTVRNNTDVVRETLNKFKIQFDTINEPIADIEQSRKVYADYYIDDRAIRFTGEWESIVKFIEEDEKFKSGLKKEKPVFTSKWHTIEDKDGYELNKGMRGVAILPYRINNGVTEFLIRSEKNPLVETGTLVSLVTGRCDSENEDFLTTAVRELKEEAGYETNPEQYINLGDIYIGKDTNTPDRFFCIDLTNAPPGKITTDGSAGEKNSFNTWEPESQINRVVGSSSDVYLLSALAKFYLLSNSLEGTRNASKRKYCCIMIKPLPDELSSQIKNIQKQIPDDLLVKQGKGTEEGNSTADGVETLHHVTVLYGVTQDDKATVKKYFDETDKKFILKNSTEVTYFDNEDETVAKVEIIVDQQLKDFRSKLKNEIPNKDSYPVWSPHTTIAYLKKGTRLPFELDQVEWEVNELTFADVDEHLTKIAEKQNDLIEKKDFNPTDALEKFLETDFIKTLLGPLLKGDKDIFEFLSFGVKIDHLAYYDKTEKMIIFDYDNFHSMLEEDKEKLFKVLSHELTHLVQDLENRLVIPEDDVVDNYFKNESEVEAVNNEIRFFKSIGRNEKEIKDIFDGSFSRFGEAYSQEHQDNLEKRIKEIN